MQDIFEKIMERLEEKLREPQYQHHGDNYYVGIYDANDIVKEVAEEVAIAENATTNACWISVSERLPEDDRTQYIVQLTNGSIDILGFAKDAYKLDKYDFAEYKGKKKPMFYDFDSEYGYIEYECEAWRPLPEKYQPKGE